MAGSGEVEVVFWQGEAERVGERNRGLGIQKLVGSELRVCRNATAIRMGV
jgi:hypothetical protein